MGDTGRDVYTYSYAVLILFGIFGNILVIISILRHKNVLKNNYSFLVLHLAICDLGALIICLLDGINFLILEEPLFHFSKLYCFGFYVSYFFQVSGIGMMLMISVLRYCATVHPLKPAISRRKLKLVCGFIYIVGIIAGYGLTPPLCFMNNDVTTVYIRYYYGYFITCFLVSPTVFVAVVYSKIGQALVKQNKHIKRVCSNLAVGRTAPTSSFTVLTFFRNQKTFFVCLLTVVCYGFANIVVTLPYILITAEKSRFLKNYYWIKYCANFLQIAGWHAANPLIYGILDKKLIKFWKLCHKKKRTSPEH